jgi:hypothetical protein
MNIDGFVYYTGFSIEYFIITKEHYNAIELTSSDRFVSELQSMTTEGFTMALLGIKKLTLYQNRKIMHQYVSTKWSCNI